LSPASSDSIDFDLVTFFTPCFLAMSITRRQTSAPSLAQSTVAPVSFAFCSKRFQPQVEIVDDLVADRRGRVARALEIVQVLDRLGALGDELALGVLQVALQDHVGQLGGHWP
jgi:hypothetical protein